MPYAKNHIRVKVPNRSGFDKSHRNSGTGLAGTLLPLLFDEVIPNSRVSLKVNLATQLPPLVSDTYMNVKHKVEAFFVPGRLLCKSYEGWFCDVPKRTYNPHSATEVQTMSHFSDLTPAVPCLSFVYSGSSPSPAANLAGPGSLLDYLGFGFSTTVGAQVVNMLPLIAYHLVWQEFYRNPNVQNPAFCPTMGAIDTDNNASAPRISGILDQFFCYPSTGVTGNYLFSVDASNLDGFKCADGVSLFSLRQRNYGLDYFTGARARAQQGYSSNVTFTTPAQGTAVNISIAQIRAANSLQMFRERNNLPGSRLVEQVKARYGAILSDGVAQRPICIGSATYDYGSHGIDQTAAGASTSSANPFSDVAAQFGRAYVAGSDFLIDDFVANEPGYVLVLHSLVPVATYPSGLDPVFSRYVGPGCITDMANPLLQNVGDQPVYQNELGSTFSSTAIFGYQDRYADFMFKRNQVHGLFKAGQSLSSFVLKRGIGSSPVIGTNFLEIPTTALDDVLQVASTSSGVSFWYDSMLDYKVSMPLAEFSIPSLQDPAYEHGQSVSLKRNGQIF